MTQMPQSAKPEKNASGAGITDAGITDANISDVSIEGNLELVDETLLRLRPASDLVDRQPLFSALDQAFQNQRVVLLHGEDGAGKTVSAGEYARREALAGRTQGQPVIYTSWLTCWNLSDVLESFGQVYEPSLLERQVEWQGLEDFQRRKLVQDLAKKVPFLWIWDDFDSLEERRAWKREEKADLLELLGAFGAGGARLLILSRHAELPLLGERPLMAARVELHLEGGNALANAIGRKQSAAPGDARGQGSLERALRLAQLALNERQRSLLVNAGLHVGCVSLDVLEAMADESAPWRVAALSGMDREGMHQALERAVESGLLESLAPGLYTLHPGVGRLLRQQLAPADVRTGQRAFTRSVARLSRQWAVQAGSEGAWLQPAEANLRLALEWASRFRWRGALLDVLAGLRRVMLSTHRYAAWNRILEQVERFFVHPQTHVPASVKDDALKTYLQYRVECAIKRQRHTQAANWQALLVTWQRKYVPKARGAQSEIDLALALGGLGAIFRASGSPKSIEAYQEAYQLVKQAGETTQAAAYALQIAEAYLHIPVVKNYDRVQEWLQAAEGLLPAGKGLHPSRIRAMQGQVAFGRFLDAQKENKAAEIQVGHLNDALEATFEALELLSESEAAERGGLHEMIGYLYLQSQGMLEPAIEQYDEAIGVKRQVGDVAGASRAQFHLAVALFLISQFEKSRAYGEAALAGFEAMGLEGLGEAAKVRRFLEKFPQPAPEAER